MNEVYGPFDTYQDALLRFEELKPSLFKDLMQRHPPHTRDTFGYVEIINLETGKRVLTGMNRQKQKITVEVDPYLLERHFDRLAESKED